MNDSGIAIRLDDLTKFYGSHRGIEDVNIKVPKGIIFGFLGPNGAGKTTTIRLLLGYLKPDKGRIKILGQTDIEETKSKIGYLPEEFQFYENVEVGNLLKYFLQLRQINNFDETFELAERFKLNLRQKVRELSKGTRQKVGIIQAFMHNPELLILDEPISGLDPLMQKEFHNLLEENVKQEKTIFLSSHNIHEVERFCQEIAVLKEGKLVANGSVKDLLKGKQDKELEDIFLDIYSF